MVYLKHVLVPTDFSEASAVALDYGRTLARTFGATLHVLHVSDDLAAMMLPTGGVSLDLGRFQTEMETAARRSLDQLLDDDDRQALGARPVLVTSHAPAAAIATYARENGVDLIVMATHGRTGMAHALMGSVAEKVVRSAPCPVLTVRHPEHEFLRPDALQAVQRA
ncbi:MAG: universal stress protein [Vicinamibacterales bacterium]